jgi:DNA (cytosine-5)-methyltransferase 1
VTVPAQAVGFNWQNGGGYGKANDGLGITEEGTGPLQRCNTPAVAFKPGQSEAAGGTFVTEEFAPTMQAQNNGSTAVPAVSFNAYQRTEGEATWPIGASDGRKVEVGVRSGMQVRRLTAGECEFLMGFPAGHTAITFRKKPAADGPRYRALGNSMAVPCMVWLGHRIQQATKGDNT